jgi:hypothetical protein
VSDSCIFANYFLRILEAVTNLERIEIVDSDVALPQLPLWLLLTLIARIQMM